VGNQRTEDPDGWLRRQAVQLAGQLPPDIDDARKVVEMLADVVERFLAPKKAPERPVLSVVADTKPDQADCSKSVFFNKTS